MSTHIHEAASNAIGKLADRRLDWDRIRRQIDAALHHEHADNPPDHHMGPFLTVSRMEGAGGTPLAHRAGETLGWPVFDGEIADLIADTFKLDGVMVHLLDEAGANWVRDVLGDLMPHQVINRDTYVHHLGKVLRLVALHGKVVLVGRGANLFLPRSQGLAVRVVAPLAERIRRVSRRDGIGEDAARRQIEEADKRRADFIRHYFDRDVDDPLLYDLVLNRSALSDDDLAEIVVAASRRRGLVT